MRQPRSTRRRKPGLAASTGGKPGRKHTRRKVQQHDSSAGEPRSANLIVGIGASAGGLEAFKTFFTNMPSDSGLAFVVVQHLSPDHKSLLADLIGRVTAMPVAEAVDDMPVAANRVTTRR